MPYIYIVVANLLFAISSIFYAKYARSHGVLWMNMTKTLVALIGCLTTLSIFGLWTRMPAVSSWPFAVSGFIGLGLGDIFLVSAFSRIGSARTMVLWGFQPIFVSIGSYFLFGETVNGTRLIAMIFLISCLLTFSYEGFKKKGKWEYRGLAFAMAGVLLDAIGLFFSRHGFEITAVMHPLEGHLFRCAGAMICFLAVKQFLPFGYKEKLRSLSARESGVIVLSSFLGTFLAIYLALSAIQIGHLPSLAALSITNPLFTSMFEHISEKKWPSRVFVFAFAQFLMGFYLLVGYE